MEILEWIAVVSAAVSLVSLAIVIIELRLGRKQSKTAALIRIYDINRELLAMGLEKPELLQAIGDESSGEEALERRYLQLWINQIALIHSMKERGLFDADQWDSLSRDISYFTENPKVRLMWPNIRRFYTSSFQRFMETKFSESQHAVAAEDSAEEPSAA